MTREDFEDEITLILDSETGSDNTFHVDALMACYDDQRALIEQQAKEIEQLREHIITLSDAQIEANAKTKEYYQQVINRLNETITSLQTNLTTANSEIERLKLKVEEWIRRKNEIERAYRGYGTPEEEIAKKSAWMEGKHD